MNRESEGELGRFHEVGRKTLRILGVDKWHRIARGDSGHCHQLILSHQGEGEFWSNLLSDLL